MKNTYAIRSLIILALNFGSIGHAQTDSVPVEIKSVDENKTKILVQSEKMQTLKVGDLLNVGDDCTLSVAQKKSTQIILNSELCNNKQLLFKGATIQLRTSEEKESKPHQTHSSTLPTGIASKGFRVEFIKSFLDGKLQLNNGTLSSSASGKMDHDFGIGFGYANIGVNTPGFITRAIFTQYNSESNSIRIDGSGTYGVNDQVYFLAGLNLHKFTKGADQFNIGFGYQLGAGFQMNENFGLGLSYVTLNNSKNVNGINLDFEAKGIELNLHGTF